MIGRRRKRRKGWDGRMERRGSGKYKCEDGVKKGGEKKEKS